jgi:hypothetical protein
VVTCATMAAMGKGMMRIGSHDVIRWTCRPMSLDNTQKYLRQQTTTSAAGDRPDGLLL